MGALPVSVKALFIQIAALLAAGSIAASLTQLSAFQPSLSHLVVMAGVLAAAIGHGLKLPPWWLPIQAGFLPAMVATLTLDIAPPVYLGMFLLLLLFYWSTFRTRVPLFLCGKKTWQRVAEQLPDFPGFRFIDLGSGLGGLPLYLAAIRPDGIYRGAEIAPAPWLISNLRARLLGRRVHFLRVDYETLDLADYDVVFVFLSPAVMPDMWRKARHEMRSGSLLLSLAFPVPGYLPDLVVQVERGARHTLYGWKM